MHEKQIWVKKVVGLFSTTKLNETDDASSTKVTFRLTNIWNKTVQESLVPMATKTRARKVDPQEDAKFRDRRHPDAASVSVAGERWDQP